MFTGTTVLFEKSHRILRVIFAQFADADAVFLLARIGSHNHAMYCIAMLFIT